MRYRALWTSPWARTSQSAREDTPTPSSPGSRTLPVFGSTWSIQHIWPSSRSWMPSRQAASSSTTNSRSVEMSEHEHLTAGGLKSRLDAGEQPILLDVREPWEFEAARIEGSTLIPMSRLEERFTELDPACEIVVICHHGNRSSYVTRALRRAGFEKVMNLEGGLDAYSSVDASEPRRPRSRGGSESSCPGPSPCRARER